MNCLVVIDVQNDFVTGSLGTPEAVEMLPRLLEKMRGFEGAVLMTLDTHGEDYADTQEGRFLPVAHCVKGTEGWRFPPEVEALRESLGARVYEKPTFGSTRLVSELKRLCTDICVISNALMIKAAMPELPVYVDAAYCAGVTPEKHAAALEVMRSCQVILK